MRSRHGSSRVPCRSGALDSSQYAQRTLPFIGARHSLLSRQLLVLKLASQLQKYSNTTAEPIDFGWWNSNLSPPCSCAKTYVSYAIIKRHQSADSQNQQQRSIARTIQMASNSISTQKWILMLTFPCPLSTTDSQSHGASAPATMNNSNRNTSVQ